MSDPIAVSRRLVAVFAADVEGYSRLMGADEVGTLKGLTERRAILDRLIREYRGRVANTAGDSILAEFGSAVDAVQCAVEAQNALAEANSSLAPDRRISFRVGIHIGDVMVRGGDLFGDGVNIAARLQSIAKPGSVCISGATYDQVRKVLPMTFVDLGAQQVKNIEEPVRVYQVGTPSETRGAAHARGSETESPPPLPDKPSIAALPFQNMSGDPEQEYFADGMVEEIITALSRIKWLFVIARNSSFTYKGRAVDVKRVGRELGVRYVLEGSVRKSGGRVRITGQLIDAISGTHLWADHFDGSLEDIFELQDRVATSVAGVIEPALMTAEMHRSAARPTTDRTAYDFYLRALATFYPETQERLFSALRLLEQAIEIDPRYGPALSWAAMCHLRVVLDGWAKDPETNRRKAVELARQALQVVANDPSVLVHSAFVLTYFGEDIGTMLGLVDRALALNPSYARGWYMSGLLRSYAGEHDLAITQVETSLRLSPRERMGAPMVVIGVAHFFKRTFDEALAKLLLAIQDQPGYPASYRYLAACYAHMGHLDEARRTATQLRLITHQVMPSIIPFRRPEDRELLLTGLGLATAETPSPSCVIPGAEK
jgi:adenylate cyclase